MSSFNIKLDYHPKGDQQNAIDFLTNSIENGNREQILLGVTGSGKTFTMANVIQNLNRPTLIMAHNKTLAAQLYTEFKGFFPDNAVGYFVSYYDYYQPEAYIPNTDTYIEKDSAINDAIDRMRHEATKALFERNDVIIIASVSCIYGLGSPEAYAGMLLFMEKGVEIERDAMLSKLVEMQYDRNNIEFQRGNFRVRGDVVEIFPSSAEKNGIRVELFGDSIDSLSEFDPITGKTVRQLEKIAIYPNSHYVISPDSIEKAIKTIDAELAVRIRTFKDEGKLLEAQRIEERTCYDMEMIREIGHCKGIENYSRHFTGRRPGDAPPTLIDYFPDNFLLMIDESHASVPQIGGMYAGDRSRKSNLVDFGFRLPSALDNRPLMFGEFEHLVKQVVYVSATPGPYELAAAGDIVVEQIIRPTGLMDPPISVRPAQNQIDDLLEELRLEVSEGSRVMVTTLTKKMAEDITEYFKELGLKVEYLHSGIDTIERTEIIRNLRLGTFDILVGINLMREGLDIPEVSLVAILDADKEGFLRSERSLIQTAGRAARNVKGRVILYGDKITRSMQATIDETDRRRLIQAEYNKKHNITPQSIRKDIGDKLYEMEESDYHTVSKRKNRKLTFKSSAELMKKIKELETEMYKEAKKLNFEKAAELRDEIADLKLDDLYS